MKLCKQCMKKYFNKEIDISKNNQKNAEILELKNIITQLKNFNREFQKQIHHEE